MGRCIACGSLADGLCEREKSHRPARRNQSPRGELITVAGDHDCFRPVA